MALFGAWIPRHPDACSGSPECEARLWNVGTEQALRRRAETRRYIIKITNVTTGTLVVFAGADWRDDERRVAVARVMRLAGVLDAGHFTESDKPKAD